MADSALDGIMTMRSHGEPLPVLALVALCVACTSCKRAEGGDKEQTAPPVSVQTRVVATEQAVVLVKATGTVEAQSDVTVVTQSAGTITKVLFELGDDVEEGQKLATLDTKLQRLAVKQAQAQLAQARAAADLATLNSERMVKLVESGSASKAEHDQAAMQDKSASAAVSMASIALAQAREALTRTTVTAPISGKVTLKLVTRGQTVAMGTPVAQVTDLTRLKVTVGLTEREVADLVVGQSVRVTSSVNPQVHCTGRIAAIGFKAMGPTRAFPVEVWIDEPDARLHPGMTVALMIEVSTIESAVLVHVNDIFEDDEGTYVWVVEAKRATRRKVETGQKIDERIVIASGLVAGDRVVLTGGDMLREGALVMDTTVSSQDP